MRRLILGLLVVSAMACDVEGIDDELELGMSNERSVTVSPDPGAPAATVKLTSWHDGTSLVSNVYCEDFTQLSGSSCYCNEDPALTGAPNTNTSADKCVLCQWWQWPDGVCELGTFNDVSIEIVANATYSFLDDGVEQVIDTVVPWTLGYDGSSCTCDPTSSSCSCGDDFLDFTVEKTLIDGTLVEESSPVIELAQGLTVSARTESLAVQTQIACRSHFSVQATGCTCDDYGLSGTLDAGQCVVCPWSDDLSCDLTTSADLHLVFTSSTHDYVYLYDHDGSPTSIQTGVPWILSDSGAGSCSCSGADCGCTSDTLDFEAVKGGINPDPLIQTGSGNVGSG